MPQGGWPLLLRLGKGVWSSQVLPHVLRTEVEKKKIINLEELTKESQAIDTWKGNYQSWALKDEAQHIGQMGCECERV